MYYTVIRWHALVLVPGVALLPCSAGVGNGWTTSKNGVRWTSTRSAAWCRTEHDGQGLSDVDTNGRKPTE